MLIIHNIKKTYSLGRINTSILKGISAEIRDGEFVALMGPSGSGKTTLLNIISGFLPADSGQIQIDGEDILNTTEDKLAELRNRKLGFVFQDFMLISGLTIRENIYLPQIISMKPISQMEAYTEKLLKMFGIEEIADHYPDTISGGQKQRTSIARALSNNPSIILADEPTGNLDSKSSSTVIDAFLTAKTNMHATIFMVTHDAFAASHCDRVIALKDGQIVSQLYRNEQKPKDFFDQLLDFTGKVFGDTDEL